MAEPFCEYVIHYPEELTAILRNSGVQQLIKHNFKVTFTNIEDEYKLILRSQEQISIALAASAIESLLTSSEPFSADSGHANFDAETRLSFNAKFSAAFPNLSIDEFNTVSSSHICTLSEWISVYVETNRVQLADGSNAHATNTPVAVSRRRKFTSYSNAMQQMGGGKRMSSSDSTSPKIVNIGPMSSVNSAQEDNLRNLGLVSGVTDSVINDIQILTPLTSTPSSPTVLEQGRGITAANDPSLMRPIIVDGCNVAIGHGRQNVYSCRGIYIVAQYWMNRGHRVIVVLRAVPRFHLRDTYLIDRLKDLSPTMCEVVKAQSRSLRRDDNKLVYVNPYDDRLILDIARNNGGVIVSNDQFRDLSNHADKQTRDIINTRLLTFTFVGDGYFPPSDPMGKTGPHLDQFVRFLPGEFKPAAHIGTVSIPPPPLGHVDTDSIFSDSPKLDTKQTITPNSAEFKSSELVSGCSNSILGPSQSLVHIPPLFGSSHVHQFTGRFRRFHPVNIPKTPTVPQTRSLHMRGGFLARNSQVNARFSAPPASGNAQFHAPNSVVILDNAKQKVFSELCTLFPGQAETVEAVMCRFPSVLNAELLANLVLEDTINGSNVQII